MWEYPWEIGTIPLTLRYAQNGSSVTSASRCRAIWFARWWTWPSLLFVQFNSFSVMYVRMYVFVTNFARLLLALEGLKRMRPKPSGNYLGNGRLWGKTLRMEWYLSYDLCYVCCKFVLCAFKFSSINTYFNINFRKALIQKHLRIWIIKPLLLALSLPSTYEFLNRRASHGRRHVHPSTRIKNAYCLPRSAHYLPRTLDHYPENRLYPSKTSDSLSV